MGPGGWYISRQLGLRGIVGFECIRIRTLTLPRSHFGGRSGDHEMASHRLLRYGADRPILDVCRHPHQGGDPRNHHSRQSRQYPSAISACRDGRDHHDGCLLALLLSAPARLGITNRSGREPHGLLGRTSCRGGEAARWTQNSSGRRATPPIGALIQPAPRRRRDLDRGVPVNDWATEAPLEALERQINRYPGRHTRKQEQVAPWGPERRTWLHKPTLRCFTRLVCDPSSKVRQ